MGCGTSATIIPAAPQIPVLLTFVGLPGTGKTSIIEYLAGEFDPALESISTAGTSIRNIEIHEKYYEIYDTCGYLSHKDDWIPCIQNSDGIVLVFDPTAMDYSSLSVTQLFEAISPVLNEKKVPVLTIMTKTDDIESPQFNTLQTHVTRYLKDCTYSVQVIKLLDDKVFEVFSWLEENL